jgi:hypothetical protein
LTVQTEIKKQRNKSKLAPDHSRKGQANKQQPARPELSRRRSPLNHSSTSSLLLNHLPPNPSRQTMSTRSSSKNSMPVSKRITNSERTLRKRSSPVPLITLPVKPYNTRKISRMRTWRITMMRMRSLMRTTRCVTCRIMYNTQADMLVKGAEAPAANQDCKQQ